MSKVLFPVFIIIFMIACTVGVTPEEPSLGAVHSQSQTFYKTIKVNYTYHYDKGVIFEFDLYKSRPRGSNKSWKLFDSFEISPTHHTHEYSGHKLYVEKHGPWPFQHTIDIYVDYNVSVDYMAQKVSMTGKVTVKDRSDNNKVIDRHPWDEEFMFPPSVTPIDKYYEDIGGAEYEFVETSYFWSMFCSRLPCGPWVIVPPQYSQTYLPVNLDGFVDGELYVQLWKGFCPRFDDGSSITYFNQVYNNPLLTGIIDAAQAVDDNVGLDMFAFGDEFPGGIGAEVGIYYISDVPALEDVMWYPVNDYSIEIKFVLVNPNSNPPDTLIHAPERKTWWRTRWMATDSYNSYRQHYPCPDNPLEYELHYWINGIKQPVWTDTTLWHLR